MGWQDDGTDYPVPNDPGPEDNPAADDATEALLTFNRQVHAEVGKLRVREAARQAHKLETTPVGEPFDSGLLVDVLARPADPPMRVEGLIPSDGGCLIAAQRKTGKTTLTLNLARCLITGEPFLGSLDVRPVSGTVALLNYEVSGSTVARWADEVGVPDRRLLLVNLRGRRNPLAVPEDRARLVALLRSHEVESIIVDPFGRAYTGTSQNDPGEVGSWLMDLDLFARAEVGATDVILTAHAGWNGERTRGSSALEDWADTVLTMTRDADDETQRFIRAMGRDVELAEDRLGFDPATRLLSLSGVGSRKAAKDGRNTAQLAVLVVRALRGGQVVGRATLEKAIKAMDDAPTFRSGEVGKAAEFAQSQGFISIEDMGLGRPKVFSALEAQPIPTHPGPIPGTGPNPSHPSYRGTGMGSGGSEGVPVPETGPTSEAVPVCATCGSEVVDRPGLLGSWCPSCSLMVAVA